jgi:hypothetical protein
MLAAPPLPDNNSCKTCKFWEALNYPMTYDLLGVGPMTDNNKWGSCSSVELKLEYDYLEEGLDKTLKTRKHSMAVSTQSTYSCPYHVSI